MKKNLIASTLTVLSVAALSATAFAHDDEHDQDGAPRYDRADYRQNEYQRDDHQNGDDRRYQDRGDRGASLRAEIDHLSAMFAHVRAEIRTYGGGRHVRSEFAHLLAERDQVSRQFERGYANPYRVHGEIEHMHDGLHHLEEEMHVRANGYYRW